MKEYNPKLFLLCMWLIAWAGVILWFTLCCGVVAVFFQLNLGEVWLFGARLVWSIVFISLISLAFLAFFGWLGNKLQSIRP